LVKQSLVIPKLQLTIFFISDETDFSQQFIGILLVKSQS